MREFWRPISTGAVLIGLLILVGCSPPGPPATPPASSPATALTEKAPTPTIPPSAQPGMPQHRIGVRVVNGIGEFYDRVTGERFVPRGNNFARLAPQRRDDGSTQICHSVFDPGEYDPADVAGHLARMHAEGYNVLRVFISQNTIGAPPGGLSPEYMENVADFLRLAGENGMYVILTQDWLPGGRYGAAINQDCCDLFNFNNAQNLPAGAVKAYQLYYTDFINVLRTLGAHSEQILSYELRNEFYFDTNYPPLSLTSGNVTTANGKTYDMSSAADKQAMVDENLPYWINSIREVILEYDPSALVSIGFFVPQAPNPARLGDTRLSITEPAMWHSDADFIDLHAYPGFELNLKQHVENFGVNGMQEKPIILGEFGASIHSYPTPAAAAQALMNWQIESCEYGFDGWLLWTWDLPEQYEFYSAMSGTGPIDAALAPANRPDPCQTGETGATGANLALGAAVTASASLVGEPPAHAADGLPGTTWISGAGPSQWIEIDLGQISSIRAIRLLVAQSPAGSTRHQVYVRGPAGSLELVHTFSGETADGDFLEFAPTQPLTDVQFIRIVTPESPSWVAWREIEVIGR